MVYGDICSIHSLFIYVFIHWKSIRAAPASADIWYLFLPVFGCVCWQLPILVSSVVSLYFLEWTDVFKPVKSGFNCHDRSLSLPYIDPNHEVIPLLMLLSLAFAGPAITVRIRNEHWRQEIMRQKTFKRWPSGYLHTVSETWCIINNILNKTPQSKWLIIPYVF